MVNVRPRIILRRIVVGVLLLVGGTLAVLLALPTGRYLLRAAWEESRILLARRPIARLAADSATAPAVRERLRLVLDARQFAESALGLDARQSFTTYTSLRSDTLVLVLSAAYRDRLEPVTWWFPVVGRVPYKGYFDAADAQRARDDFARRGFDTYLRPASAFSTLGWFNDPLVSTTLRTTRERLVNTVVHELAHNTVFVPSEVEFNESLASFIGARGAAAFFAGRGDTAAERRVDEEWEDEKRLAVFWEKLARQIDSVFAANPGDSAARVRARDAVYARARVTLVDSLGPLLPTVPRQWLERLPLDNAALLARRVYARRLDLFDAYWDRNGRDLRGTIAALRATLDEDGVGEAFSRVERALGSSDKAGAKTPEGGDVRPGAAEPPPPVTPP